MPGDIRKVLQPRSFFFGESSVWLSYLIQKIYFTRKSFIPLWWFWLILIARSESNLNHKLRYLSNLKKASRDGVEDEFSIQIHWKTYGDIRSVLYSTKCCNSDSFQAQILVSDSYRKLRYLIQSKIGSRNTLKIDISK